jgi:polysaccharide biosynthesis transport protein
MQEQESSELKLHALDYWQVLRNRYGIILLTFLLILISAGVITYLLPKQYLGKVVLEVKSQAADVNVFDQGSSAYQSHYFLDTQFEIIRSKETLYGVIDELGLVQRWGLNARADAYNVLRSRIEANPVRGTELIEVEVYSPDYREAADIANAVAEKYKERRIAVEAQKNENAIASLLARLEEARTDMEQKRSRMLDLMEKSRVVEIGSGMRGFSEDLRTGTNNLVEKAKQEEFELDSRIRGLKSSLETLEGLEGEDLVRMTAGLELSDQSHVKRFEEYRELQLQVEAMRQTGLGEKHPKLMAVKGQVDGLKGMLVDSAEALKRQFAKQLEMAEASLANAATTTESQTDEAMDEQRKTMEYKESQSDYYLAKEIMSSIETKLATYRVDMQTSRTPIVIHEEAEPDSTPRKPRVGLNLILGSVVGLVMGMVLAFFLEYLDTSVKSLDEVERYLGVPVLAVIPKDVGILHRESIASPDAEAYRILRTNIEFNRKSADANSLTVVSGGAGEGKSTTITNLAFVCAQGGYTTILIDADLRRPSLHKLFDVGNSFGLTNYLSNTASLEQVVLQTPIENLYFLPSGILPADAAGILNSRRMSELISDVKSRFDLVLIDSPPILGVSDASVLASEADHTLIVIQHRKLPRGMLLRVKQAIENVGGNVIGAVLNNVDVKSDSSYQYYTSYYTYYSASGGSQAEPAAQQVATPSFAASPQEIAPAPYAGSGGGAYPQAHQQPVAYDHHAAPQQTAALAAFEAPVQTQQPQWPQQPEGAEQFLAAAQPQATPFMPGTPSRNAEELY